MLYTKQSLQDTYRDLLEDNNMDFQDLMASIKDVDTCIRYAHNNINRFCKKTSWYKPYKRNSIVMGCLWMNKELFENLKATLDDVVKLICSLLNINKHNNMIRVPERYLAQRLQLSADTVYKILYILNRIGLVKLKKQYGVIYYKLVNKYIKPDIYIKKKSEEFYDYDIKCKMKIQDNGESMYYYSFTNETINKNRRRMIMGITLAYNELLEKYLKVKEENPFGNEPRDDIDYVEVPVNILSNLLNMSEDSFRSYLHKLYKNCKYISKHDKQYVDTFDKESNFYLEHYCTPLYKDCDLQDSDKNIVDPGHPIITENSAIIHMNAWKSSCLGKEVIPKLSEYKNMVLNEMKYYLISEFTNTPIEIIKGNYEINDNFCDDVDSEFKDDNSFNKYIKNEVLTDNSYIMEYVDGAHIQDINRKAKKGINRNIEGYSTSKDISILSHTSIKDIKENYNVSRCCKKLKLILDRMSLDCPDDIYNRYIRLSTVLVEKLKDLREYCIKQGQSYTQKFDNILLEFNLLNVI